MKWTGVNELRESYLQFFESKNHLRHKSFPLVPQGDKSLLLINAGMTPLKKYFTGEEEPPRRRMTTCQKCIRTPDIDRVGITARHGTFFEMLGNFSFGDYFKEEALPWAWEYITEVLEMPVDKLWATIYEEDDEAYDIWVNKIGLPAERVVRLGKADNFWEHGSGPCGPCSEIHFDRGPEFGCGSPDCKPGCDCDRYMEFWNNVFTQFESDGAGTYTRLANPNIDTGMGLERLACIMQGVNNLFEVDTVRNIMMAICEKANVKYGEDEKSDISLRVITDHIRSSTFLICDGVVPSNEGRGYVLRRLMRRAARHGRMLGIEGTFLADLVDVVAKENLSEYPELTEKADYIKKIVSIEEDRFAATIDAGLSILSNLTRKALSEGKTEISGEDVFKLYDTFGFPIDLTREIAAEANLTLDEEAFKQLMNDQRQRARAARADISGWADASKGLLEGIQKTEFVGYETTRTEAKVIAIIADDMPVDRVTEGDFTLITDKTPFYGEGGGQVGDIGAIYDNDSLIAVGDTKKTDGVFLHICSMANGDIQVGDTVIMEVDAVRRQSIMRNHSACHLLQAALRQVLGAHVEQAGSYVDADRVRFDFSHYAAMTKEELQKVEMLVNSHILLAQGVQTKETDIESARKEGAMALFGEKYGKVVRVVKMGNFSTELCGGTHVDNTGKIGLFKVLTETSVAAGVRRIEGTTGLGVLHLIAEKDALIADTAKELKSPNPHDIAKRAGQLQSELKSAKSEIESLEAKIASAKLDAIRNGAKTVGSVKLMAARVDGASVDAVRGLCDNIRAEDASSVVVIALVNGGKLNFVASCGADAVKSGANAGKLVKEAAVICGGGGGGRPDSAMAGGKDASKVDAALAAVETALAGMLK
ncbi:MAG: alanine--tRNA ligase [Ruminococcaceae bacterium]|nr:alanine--tRNA ligase [Oscillospiraceae bacterium]